jgi:isoleucyl-tRNA synthetase
MNLKDSLNLPKTDFPMRANLPENEPKRLKAWEDEDTYVKLQEQNKASGKTFCMPDGPPYANGDIHLGHVLNKVLKDITLKQKSMMGYHAPLYPGWDGHGLPIELKVTKALGPKRHEKTKKEIRSLCRDEAKKWIKKQEEQFKRLGVMAHWDQPYWTIQTDYEAEEVRVLSKIYERGLIYKGKKPVFWCPKLQTALADTEVEYMDHESPSIYVSFPFAKGALDGSPLESFADEEVSAVIWTTTPWTIPANLAISLHPDFDYQLLETNKGRIILAKDLVESVEKDAGLEVSKVLCEFKGNELEGLKARHPFLDRDSLLVTGEHVTLDAGTGLVHTAPGHGVDDYQVGLRYDLEIFSPVGPDGKYTKDYPQREGEFIFTANPEIVKDLDEAGRLISHKVYKHSYPHNWRSKTPLIFRATPQWFLKVDDEDFSVRKKSLEMASNEIEFVPGWGKSRLEGMLKNRPDWCISRQRIWGVPIPALICQSCGEAWTDKKFMSEVADRMEKSEEGIEAYFEGDLEDLYPEKCPHCGGTHFKKSEDILDVWFDSGVCHSAVQKKREGLTFPADIYLEGSDQHRGWFQTSLLSSVAAYDETPFKALITHGFVNDSKGRKMSKSLGNVIDPLDVIKKSGSEILRLWVAYEDYGQDVNVSQEIFSRVTETYRRVRNTMRFMLGNIHDFKQEQAPKFSDLDSLDKWALIRLNLLIQEIREHYNTYSYYKVYHAINLFFTVDLSARYLDILKDRLYVEHKDSPLRKSSQYVLSEIVKSTAVLMAPILSFLSEEVYEHVSIEDQKDSVFLETMPEYDDSISDADLMQDYETLFELRSEVSKALEEMRAKKEIRASLEAQVALSSKQLSKELWDKYQNTLAEFFIVSKVIYSDNKAEDLKVMLAEGEKCPRCWHIEELSEHACGERLCNRCSKVMSELL